MLGGGDRASGLAGELAVVAMGKLGARELNYGSDIDVVLVGRGDPQGLVGLARQAWRIDLALRPEGRSGPLVRSLASYTAYWDRWAQTWEFQALLKARPAAGRPDLGRDFVEEASRRVWGRPLGAPTSSGRLRAMKGRAEQEVARQGLSQREIKLGRGGIRDIEFAVQLLQLVHGRQDETLRAPSTLAALRALAAGGYVARQDAEGLAGAYRFLRLGGAPPPALLGPASTRVARQRRVPCPPGPSARLPRRADRDRPGPLRGRPGQSPSQRPAPSTNGSFSGRCSRRSRRASKCQAGGRPWVAQEEGTTGARLTRPS